MYRGRDTNLNCFDIILKSLLLHEKTIIVMRIMNNNIHILTLHKFRLQVIILRCRYSEEEDDDYGDDNDIFMLIKIVDQEK